MIAQVEHTRKTGRSMALLRPETILALGSPQIGNAPRRGPAMNFAGSHQAEQRPCGLRCRTRHGLVAPVIEPVACRVFAPAAIGILDGCTRPISHVLFLARALLDSAAAERGFAQSPAGYPPAAPDHPSAL